jgi:hypothetical protein
MNDVGQLVIDQRGEHDGAHAIDLTLRIDSGNRLLRAFDGFEEGMRICLNSMSSNWVIRLWPRASTVRPVPSDTKNTVRLIGRHSAILTAVAQAGSDAVDGQMDAAARRSSVSPAR